MRMLLVQLFKNEVRSSNYKQLIGYAKVYILTDKTGKLLGRVYIKEIKKNIFNSLIIAKEGKKN